MRVRVCSEQGHEGRRWWLEAKSERGGQLGLRLSCSSARAPGPSRVSARQTQGESRLAAVYQQPPLALTLTPQRTPPDLQVAEPSRIFDGIGAHLCLSPDAGPQTREYGDHRRVAFDTEITRSPLAFRAAGGPWPMSVSLSLDEILLLVSGCIHISTGSIRRASLPPGCCVLWISATSPPLSRWGETVIWEPHLGRRGCCSSTSHVPYPNHVR
jgi:hypothetical protein